MPYYQEEENWDDDFEFGNSPRNSPIPTSPIAHAAAAAAHASGITRPRGSSTSRPSPTTYGSRSNANLHSRASSSALPRPSGSRPDLRGAPRQQPQPQPPQQQQVVQQHQQRKGRWSGNSEEDWDMDEPTMTQPARKPLPPRKARVSGNSEEDWDMEDVTPAPAPAAAPSRTNPPPPLKLDHVPPLPSDHPQPRPSLDMHSTHRQEASRTSGGPGNTSPTMSSFSIPLSIDSSLRTGTTGLHGHHPTERSIGGSSTNFLLHTGRRSLLEMEKGRAQEKERRRLRKKSRPSQGAVQVDEDAFDVYGHGRGAGVPRRYYAPRAEGEEYSSAGSSGEEELDEEDERRPSVAPAPSAPAPAASTTPLKPSRLLTALNPTKSLDKLGSGIASSSTSPATPSNSGAPRPIGLGSRSTTVTSVPPPATTPGPAKLVRKTSNSNVLTKSTPHLRSGAATASSAAKQQQQQQVTASPARAPLEVAPSQQQPRKEPPRHHAPTPSRPDDRPRTPNHHPHPNPVAAAHAAAPSSLTRAKEDCNVSLTPSTASNKRTHLLSRLGSLKQRWGHSSGSASPSSSSLGLGVPRTGRESVSPRTFGSRLPSFLGGSKVDLHSGEKDKDKEGLQTSTSSSDLNAKSPGRRYGLLRKPSLVLSSASSSALAPVPSRSGEEQEAEAPQQQQPEPSSSKKDDAHGRRGMNPFRRVSIQGVKRLVTDHHHHHHQEHDNTGSTPNGTPEKEKKDRDASAPHSRTISFSKLARGKISAATGSSKHKDVTSAGRKSVDGRESPRPAPVHSSHAQIAPHTLGRTAALAKAPKPPIKPLSSAASLAEAYNHQNLSSGSIGYGGGSSSTRIALPSSVSTATSAGYQSSSATSAAQSSTHRRTTSGATSTTASSISQSSPIMTSPPFSLAGARSIGPAHTREATVRPGIPMAGEHTPKPRGNGKPLPDVVGSGAATVGRVEGHSAAAAAAAAALKDSRVRSGSAGDTSRVGATSPSPSVGQRRTGDLKIPARISMRQGSLKRELEAVKEFATSVEDLKRLQTNHQAVLAALAPNPRRSSSRASNQAVNPATIQSIEAQYGMWWECAELLVELGGAAPPTVAGTPIQENQPSIPPRTFGSQGSANGHYGTQRSFSSSSSGGDLSTRQLEILKQMLSTPNPTTFNPSSIRWPNGGSRQELSGSGSDHIVSSSARGTKSTLNSASSLHDQPPSSVSRAQANSSNYPYAQGTWTTKNRTSNPSGSRPNLNGVFPSSETQKPAKSSQTASRGTLSGSSAAGGIVTTDDTEEEISDWDRDSSSDSGKAARKLSSHASSLKPASSTASSSVDMSHHQIPTQARLALTPETILPLLSYAREVKSRLVDCLDELERARGRSRGTPSASTAVSAAAQQQQYSSSSRGSRAPEIGTSTLRRA